MMQDILWKVDSYSAWQRTACFSRGARRFITVFGIYPEPAESSSLHRSLSP